MTQSYRENVIYSSVFGRGMYEWIDSVMDDFKRHSFSEGQFSKKTPLLKNIFTNEVFFARKLCDQNIRPEHYKNLILHPPCIPDILWPYDLVYLSKERDANCEVTVENRYTDRPEEDNGYYGAALLFSCREDVRATNFSEKLKKAGEVSWKNPEIRKLAIDFVCALNSLNHCGYIYEDFHFSRIFVKNSGELFLDFSNLIFPICVEENMPEYLANESRAEDARAMEGWYPVEFAEPAVISGKVKFFDFHSQNYSMAAFLFYLFFHRYAYEGSLMSGYLDENEQQHYNKFRDYHKIAAFIFEPGQTQNSIGMFAKEEKIISLWEECPELIKQMLLMTLREKNARRETDDDNPTPDMWLECFKRVKWF